MNNMIEAYDEDEDIEEGRRCVALEKAIHCDAGRDYNDAGNLITNSDKILNAAIKFEAYLKGDTVKETEQ